MLELDSLNRTFEVSTNVKKPVQPIKVQVDNFDLSSEQCIDLQTTVMALVAQREDKAIAGS